MAEYFPLLERAVAGLADSTPEARRAIYERAKAALLGQLRNMDPPVPEENIARESTALDDAITRLEATFHPTDAANAAPPVPDVIVTQPPVPQPPAARQTRLAPRPAPATVSKPPGLPSANVPPVGSPPPLRERPPIAPRPDGSTPQRPSAPVRTSTTPIPAEKPAIPPRPQLSARPLNTAPRIGIEPRIGRPLREAPSVSANPAAPAAPLAGPSLPVTATLDMPVSASEASRETAIVDNRDRFDRLSEGARPVATSTLDPVAPPKSTRGAGFYLALTLGVLLLAGIAFEAWKLRDRPEQLTAAQHQSAAESGSKVAERATAPAGQAAENAGEATEVPAPMAGGGEVKTASPPQAAADSASGSEGASGSLAAPASPVQTEAAPAALAPDAGAPGRADTGAVGVMQRAALLVEAPQDPQKVKAYLGTVVWKNESVSTGQGQPLSDAVLADIDIPEAKLKLSMILKRNLEPQLPASHTIEFRFTDEAGNVTGPVKQIDVPQMRLDDSSRTGDPLTGVPVAITDNSFLVGLARGNAEALNTQMMQRRNWIDVPLMLGSGKLAKITFEKGVPGQRIIDDAVKSWQSGG